MPEPISLGMPRSRVIAGLIMLIVASSALSTITASTQAIGFSSVGASGEIDGMPTEHHISNVSFVKQERMWCGPASLTMVLNYWGNPISQSEVGSAIDPEHDGTKPWHMIPFLESIGYDVHDFDRYSLEYRSSVMDELRIWICHDYPIVVRQWADPSKEEGHYRVVVGYDAEMVHVVDPDYGSDVFDLDYFLQLWERNYEYGLVIIGDPVADSDGDQLADCNEVVQNTDVFDSDTDSDGIPDGRDPRPLIPNEPPVASFTESVRSAPPGTSIDFDARGSSDPEGIIVAYEWDFDGDGVYDATGMTVTHSFSSPGTFTVTLKVVDDGGLEDTATDEVLIAPHPTVPVVSLGIIFTLILIALVCYFLIRKHRRKPCMQSTNDNAMLLSLIFCAYNLSNRFSRGNLIWKRQQHRQSPSRQIYLRKSFHTNSHVCFQTTR